MEAFNKIYDTKLLTTNIELKGFDKLGSLYQYYIDNFGKSIVFGHIKEFISSDKNHNYCHDASYDSFITAVVYGMTVMTDDSLDLESHSNV